MMPKWALRRIAHIFVGKFLRQLHAHSTESQGILERVTNSGGRGPLYTSIREHLAERFGEEEEDVPASGVAPASSPSTDPELLERNEALLTGLTKREREVLLPLKHRIEQADGWEFVSDARGLECYR